MLKADELNLITLAPYFADADKARELLESYIWPDGAICRKCGHDEVYKLNPTSKGKTSVRKGVYKCKKCRKQFTVTVGTIFEKSRIPLNKWFVAIYMMSSSKKGISANQLHRTLDITYKSAWFMCHRIRYAMDSGNLDILNGDVEVDETYVGGKPRKENKPRDSEGEPKKKNKRGRGTDKQPVMVAVEREGEARTKVIKDVKGKTLKGFVRDNVEKSAEIYTDEFSSYSGLDSEFEAHHTVNHGQGEYSYEGINTNTAESFFSLLKRGHIGTFHQMSKTHLQRYADEFEFRWNHRNDSDGERTKALIEQVGGKRLMYKDLIKTEKE